MTATSSGGGDGAPSVPSASSAPAATGWLIKHRLSVRFRDCDPLGHVNNAVYFTYFEQSRFALWRAQLGDLPGTSPVQAGGRGRGFILARIECDFRSQARYGDELEVRVRLARVGRASFAYEYEMADAPTGRLVAEARSVQVWFDYERQETQPLPDDVKVRLARAV